MIASIEPVGYEVQTVMAKDSPRLIWAVSILGIMLRLHRREGSSILPRSTIFVVCKPYGISMNESHAVEVARDLNDSHLKTVSHLYPTCNCAKRKLQF